MSKKGSLRYPYFHRKLGDDFDPHNKSFCNLSDLPKKEKFDHQSDEQLKPSQFHQLSPGPVQNYFMQNFVDQGDPFFPTAVTKAGILHSDDDAIYDPTNGTVSPGEIRRTSLGISSQN